MARSGATRYAVAPGDVYALGAAWDKATDLAHFLSEAALYICSSGEWSPDAKSADELEVRDAPVAPARLQVTFRHIAWAPDRWRCSRCQRYARNNSTLAALKKDGLCTTVWCCARGDSTNPEGALVSQGSTFRTDHVVHHVRGLQLKPQLSGACPSDTRSQRLRQLVIGRHPISGAWLLDDAAQPV